MATSWSKDRQIVIGEGFLLLEDGSYLLQEDGTSKFELEGNLTSWSKRDSVSTTSWTKRTEI